MDVLAAVSRKLAEAENLTGEAMQKNIAEYGGTTDERITAIQQIDDQSFLISLAISDKDKYVRYEALQRLNKIGGSSLLVELIGSYKTKGSIRHHDTLENTATMLNLSDFAGKNNELSIIVEGIWDRNNQIAKKDLDMITDKSVLMDLCNKKLYQGETGHERKGLSDKAKERLMGLG